MVKRLRARFLVLNLLSLAFLVWPLMAWPQTVSDSSNVDQTLSRGQQVSTAVATITSTAVSPLVGVCAIGIYQYFRTSGPERSKLPLYSMPKFWIPVSLLLILILFKDTVGGFAPLVKKPLDAVEVLLLNKAALVLIVFPVMLDQVARVLGANSLRQVFASGGSSLLPVVHAASLSAEGTLQTAGNEALAVLMIIVGSVAVIAVWLVGHALDVLTLLSPFPFLDLVIKGFRNAVFVALAVTMLISRQVGLVASLIVITVCLLLFGWAWRLALFGLRFSVDLLRVFILGSHRHPAAGDAIAAFTAVSVEDLPKRRFGKLVLGDDGALVFRVRRLGIGPARKVRLKDGVKYEVGRGLLYPSIILPKKEGEGYRTVFRLLPGYMGAEEQVRAILGLGTMQDIRWSKGLRAFWRWLGDESSDARDMERPPASTA